MKNKLREKIIAGIMLSAFVVTNSFATVFASSEYYGYDAETSAPVLRTEVDNIKAIPFGSSVEIPNGNSVVNLSLRDADVTQVLRMFADQAGMNIIFAPGVSGTVTMDLVDIQLKEALNLVVKTSNLYFDIKANTLVVSSAETALNLSDRTKTLTVIPVKYVNAVAISSFLNKSAFARSKSSVNPGMSNGFVVATNPATNELIVTGTEQDVMLVRRIVEQFDKKPAITTFKVNHVTPAEMSASICTSLFPTMSFVDLDEGESGGAAGLPTGFASDSSSAGMGGATSSISVGGGQLACQLTAIQKTEETTNGEETFSLDSVPLRNMIVSYFPTRGTIQIVGGSDSQLEMVREYIEANDKKAPQAYLEVQIVSLSEKGSKTFENTWQYLSKNLSFNASGGLSTNSMYPIFFAGKGYSLVGDWKKEEGGYEKVGEVGKWSGSRHLVYQMNYLIENEKARVLANPKILITSGQSSVIDLTSDYIAKVTSQYLDNGSASGSAQVQREYEIKDDNGIKIEVTPFISPDGYVTLDIKPSYKTVAASIYGKGETTETDLIATLLQRRDLDIKGARIKDGETLVIGGMIQEVEKKSVKKIPFFGDLPVLGMFFRSTTTARDKEEMVIMITPQIVLDTEDAVADDNML